MGQITWLGPHDAFPNPRFEADPDSTVPGLIAVSERIFPGQLSKHINWESFRGTPIINQCCGGRQIPEWC